MTALTLIGVIAFYLLCFWYLYVFVMGIYRAHLAGRLSKFAFILALPVIAVGFLVDLIANWTVATAVFVELPEQPEELVTDRLKRYINGPPCKRRTLAIAICDHLLDVFDPSGAHCK